jgi:hypothetical protein
MTRDEALQKLDNFIWALRLMRFPSGPGVLITPKTDRMLKNFCNRMANDLQNIRQALD